MVDITNHEDSLRELSKTSLVSNVTVILCWSAAEAARYLELYKSYEHANFSAIQGHQATSYAEKLVEFVTVPRSVNKTDAVGLVSLFGSLKNAINADPEQVGIIGGWGEKKIKTWCKVVEQPFRVKKAGKRSAPGAKDKVAARNKAIENAVPLGQTLARTAGDTPPRDSHSHEAFDVDDEADEEVALAATIAQSKKTAEEEAARREEAPKAPPPEQLSGGIAAALAKLRENG